MSKLLSLDMLEQYGACVPGKETFVLTAAKVSRCRPSEIKSHVKFHATDLFKHTKRDDVYSCWVAPLICTPAEILGLAQDIPDIVIEELELLREKHSLEFDEEFKWLSSYVRNPQKGNYAELSRKCNGIAIVVDEFGGIDVSELTMSLLGFGKIVHELAGMPPFTYDHGGYEDEFVQFDTFAYELRGNTDIIETMIENVGMFSERTLTEQINAAFITAFTPSFKTEVTND